MVKYMTPNELDKFLSNITMQYTERESKVLKEYLYQGYDINENLRCTNNTSHACTKLVNDLDKIFRVVEIPKAFALYRGVQSPLRYAINASVCDHGYCSTTKSFAIGRHFMTRDDQDEKCCVFHIHFQQHTKIRMLPVTYAEGATHAHEQEIVFPRDTRLFVITDEHLLQDIARACNYELGNFQYDDRFSSEPNMKQFPFKTFLINETNVIPVTINQS